MRLLEARNITTFVSALVTTLACSSPSQPGAPAPKLDNFVASWPSAAAVDKPNQWLNGRIPWDRVPLRVQIDGLVSKRMGKAVRNGMAFWNRATSCTLLTEVRSGDYDVYVSFGGQRQTTVADVRFEYWEKHKRWVARVRVRAFGGGKDTLVMAHEFGHAIGLAHDPHEGNSIMVPKVSRMSDQSRVTSDDARAVAHRFCMPKKTRAINPSVTAPREQCVDCVPEGVVY